jgi:thiol-disulfide isomerase/thioredoxin
MIPTVVLSFLSVLQLVVLLGVVRRLRLLGVARPAPPAEDEDWPLPLPGLEIGKFAAVTVDGEMVSKVDLDGSILVAFFAEKCPLCHDFVPRFAALAETFPGGRGQVLAVLVGADTSEMDRLRGVARVTIEPFGGPVATAFGVTAFPAFCLLEGPVVRQADFKIERLGLSEAVEVRS